MADSLVLSIFFLCTLVAEIFYFKYARLDFAFLRRGEELRLNKNGIILFTLIVFAIFYWIGYQIIIGANILGLQLFYESIYFCSLTITLFLIFGGEKPKLKLALAVVLSALLSAIVYKTPFQLGQNIYMALALLWVAPVVFRQLKINKNLFFILVVVGMVADILCVWVLRGGAAKVAFSDEYLSLNGLVTFGDYYLGIGDFLMGYLLVGALNFYNSGKVALLLAILLSLPRFLMRVVFPSLAGAVFPYYLFMVPIFFLAYFLANKKFLCIKN